MSWLTGQLQSSLGSLKNQVATSLKEVFEAVDEDEQDPDLEDPSLDAGEKLELAKKRIRELKDILLDKTANINSLKKENSSLSRQNQSLEDQKRVERDQFKSLLRDKEEEIEILVQQNQATSNDDEESEVTLLKNQIDSLQSFVAEMKTSHKKEIEDLTKSFLAQKPVVTNGPRDADDLKVEFDALQTRFLEEKYRREQLEASIADQESTAANQVHGEDRVEDRQLVEKLEEEKESLRQELVSLREQLRMGDVLKLELDKERLEKLKMQESFRDQKVELGALQEKLEEREKKFQLEIDTVRNSLFDVEQRHKSEVNSFAQKCKTSADEIERLQAQVESHQLSDVKTSEEISKLNSHLELLKRERDELREKFESVVISRDQEKENFILEIEKLKLSLETRENESTDDIHKDCTLEANALRQGIDEKTSQLNQMTSECENLREMLSELKSKNSSLSDSNVEIENRLRESGELEARVQHLETEVRSLSTNLEQVSMERDEFRNEKVALENECSDLKEKLESLYVDYEKLKTQLLSKTSDEAWQALETVRSECRQLSETLQSKETELENVQAETEALRSEILSGKSELARLAAERDRVSADLTEVSNLCEQHQITIDRLREEMASQLEKFRLNDCQIRQEFEVKEMQISQLTEARCQAEANCAEALRQSAEQKRVCAELTSRLDSLENAKVERASVETEKISSLQEELGKVLDEKEKLLKQKSSLEEEISTLVTSAVEHQKEVDVLKSQLLTSQQYFNTTVEDLNNRVHDFASKERSWLAESERMMSKLADLQRQNLEASEELEKLSDNNHSLKVAYDEKCLDLEMAKRNLQELTISLEEKSADSMSEQQNKLQTIAAIKDLEEKACRALRDREQAQTRLDAREMELQELKREVNNVIEKKRKLETEVGRLKQHLLSVEESSTQEALVSEERERELKKKLQVMEEALRVASAHQTTASREASNQVDVLEAKVSELSQERQKLNKKLQLVTAELNKKSRALENLEVALAGLHEEKRNEIRHADQAHIETLQKEREDRMKLEAEMKILLDRVKKTDEVLSTASSLGEQVAAKNQVISALKQEIKLKDELLQKAREEFGDKSVSNSLFERNLVKNLVVSYFQADAKQKPEVLSLIAKVLGFNEEERVKTGLDQPGYGLRYLRAMMPGGGKSSEPVDVSLAEAFVKFLETESTPKTPIKLPASEMAEETARRSRTSSVSSQDERPKSGSPNPLVLAANSASASLPTFSVNRSSSSILRHVLQEENSQ